MNNAQLDWLIDFVQLDSQFLKSKQLIVVEFKHGRPAFNRLEWIVGLHSPVLVGRVISHRDNHSTPEFEPVNSLRPRLLIDSSRYRRVWEYSQGSGP